MRTSTYIRFSFFILFIILFHTGYAITAPENLKAEATSQTQIYLSWDDKEKNKTYYVVERSIGNENNYIEIAFLNSKASDFTDNNLTANTTYFYRIKAVINRIFGQSSAYSNTASAITFPNPPTAPSELKSTTKSQTEIDITWKDNSDNEEGFSLERSEKNSSSFAEVIKLQPNTTSYNDKNLKSNTTYFYRIRSYNKGGDSDYSNQISSTTYQYAPTLNPIQDPAAIYENADTQELILTGISDGGDGGQQITITAISSNQELMPDPQITYSSPANTATLRYRTNRNMFGTSTITVTVKDDGPADGPVANTVSQSFKITVQERNDPPTLDAISNPAPIFENSDTQTVPLTGISAGPGEDQAVTITASSSHPEIIPDPVVSYTSPEATGTLTFKPVANKFGKVTITVLVKDNGPSSSPHENTLERKFEVTVVWVNKAPTLDAIANPAPVQHTAGEQTINLTGITAGPNDEQALTVTATTDNPEIISNLKVDYSSPQPTAVLRFTPIPDKLGTAVITVTVKDDGPGTDPHVNTISRSFTVKITDIPLVSSTNFPEYYTSNSDEPIGIVVHDNITIDKVEFHYRPVNENEWKVENITGSGKNYNVLTPADAYFGPIGMEYYFVVFANGNLEEATNTGITYLNYAGEGTTIPGLTFGDTKAHYQIVSIPLALADKKVPTVFEDDLGPYNNTQWRLFHYIDSAVEYPSKFTSIEAGKGYWLIVRREKQIDTGPGSTFKVDKSTPFNINLIKGWNQIGNPYNMDVKWSDVMQANNNIEGVGNLMVFEDGVLKESDVLKRFRGGFVFSENELSISIPVVAPASAPNGRYADNPMQLQNTEGWEVLFDVTSSGKTVSTGGVGMRSGALEGKDIFDKVAVPDFGFINQTKINFDHPEYFYPSFSKDIVPVSEDYIWEFTVDSNTKGELHDLKWNLPTLEEDHQIVLFDVLENKIIEMKENISYSFKGGENKKFRVLYGNQDFVKENLQPEIITFEKPFPNPFQNQVIFPFAVSKAEGDIHIQLNIYDVTGKVVATPLNENLLPGFHEAYWNGSNNSGRKMSPGIYIYKMTVTKDNSTTEHKGRLILE